MPSGFTRALTGGNVGLLLGSLSVGLLGDRLGPVLIGCVLIFGIFSLLSTLVRSPLQLAVLRSLTDVGLGGGIRTTSRPPGLGSAKSEARAIACAMSASVVPTGFWSQDCWRACLCLLSAGRRSSSRIHSAFRGDVVEKVPQRPLENDNFHMWVAL